MAEGPIVTVEEGQLQGTTAKDNNGRQIYKFLGIPYAKPPVGQLRFKDPVPPEPWLGIRDATKVGSCCHADQYDPSSQGFGVAESGSEDCLFLDIFTHNLPPKNLGLMPVMVWIHGGAFTSGSGDLEKTRPDFLMTQDIVLVSINYRLGALGFTSLPDLNIGNAGLKDMVRALEWIKKNIERFGGDPHCVTIFGCSAGGAAVHYLVLSPLAKGLFHRAIVQSGSALNFWARGQENNAFRLAKELGCTTTDPKKTLEFLQEMSASQILKAQKALKDSLDISIRRIFSPTIEKPFPTAFQTYDPIQLLQTGNYNQVPLMIGYTSMEGLIIYMMQVLNLTVSTNFVPFILNYKPDSKEFRETQNKIIQFYFNSDQYDAENKPAEVLLRSDTEFVRGIYQAAKYHAKTSSAPVYLYRINIETKVNFIKKLLNTNIPGVPHGDELGYILKVTLFGNEAEYEANSPEDIGIQRFVKIWTNFARNGYPIPENNPLFKHVDWKPIKDNNMNCLILDKELKSGENPDGDRMKFWDEILKPTKGY